MDAYVLDAWRTPRGRGKAEVGGLSMLTPLELASGLLKQIPRVAVEELILGCVTQTGEQGGCIARTAVLDAGWPQTIPAFTVNRFCASGLEAVNLAAAKVQAGDGLVLAGGVESMSRVPMGSDGGAWLLDPRVVREQAFVPQGIGADLIATREGFTREQLDAWALRSHQRAAAAQVRLTPLNALQHDECVRPGTTLEGLAALQPSFAKMGAAGADALALTRYPDVPAIDHRHHAGNSSAIADGAALVLVGSQSAAAASGIRPRARIRAVASVGSEPTIMLTGPAPAVNKALARAGMTAADIDLWEINEAFAAVPLQVMRALDIDPERVNVNGGAIALGHPLGATGAMLLGTVLDELERRNLATACVTLCVGGGMGTATIVERC